MEGWSSFAVEQCCDILDSMRVPVNAEDRDKRIGEIPYYGANGLQGYIDDFIFDEPLILIAEDGGCFDEFANRPIAYRIRGKSWVNNHAHVLRAKEAFCQDAVFYNLEHKDIQSFIVGGTRSKLNQAALRAITLTLPTSKPEQTKIAEVLSTVDRTIEQTEALIAKQQRIKTGLMQDLLTRGIDEHGNLRSEQTHKFKDSPLGRIPVEWGANELRSYLSYLSYGFTNPMPEAKEGPYMVTAANVSNGFVQYDNCRRTNVKAYEKLLTKKSRPEIGDILITKDGTLGRLAIVDRLPLCINQSVAVMRPKDGVDNSYLKLLLESPKYQKRILDDAGGSTIKHIYISKIDKIVLGFPKAKAEQEAIKERLLFQSNVLYQYEANLKKLRSLKTALMQDLLTGKKRVTIQLKETTKL